MYQLDPRNTGKSSIDAITGRNVLRSSIWFYLAFEGDNESNYFKIVKDHKSALGIKENVDCIRLYRYEREKDETDPRWIKERVEEYRRHLVGEYVPRFFLSYLLNYYIRKVRDEESKRTSNTEYRQLCVDLENTIHSIEGDLLDKLESDDYCTNGIITDTNEAMRLVKSKLKEVLPRYKNISTLMTASILNSKMTLEDIAHDHFCIIVDRDHTSDKNRLVEGELVEDYYDNLIDEFANCDIELFVTCPAFEFWLALHFDDLKFDENKMRENEWVGKTHKRYSEWILSEHIQDYCKYRLDPIHFVGRDKDCKPIKDAIKRIEDNGYADTLEQLKTRIGSNIPVLIRKMQGASNPMDDESGCGGCSD